jgi:hypothetical protein
MLAAPFGWGSTVCPIPILVMDSEFASAFPERPCPWVEQDSWFYCEGIAAAVALRNVELVRFLFPPFMFCSRMTAQRHAIKCFLRSMVSTWNERCLLDAVVSSKLAGFPL